MLGRSVSLRLIPRRGALSKAYHPYHLVDPSPWPYIGSIGALLITVGSVLYFHYWSYAWIMYLGQEIMRVQRGRLSVQPLGYVMSTKVIFRRAEVIVLAVVFLMRRPHASQPWSDV